MIFTLRFALSRSDKLRLCTYYALRSMIVLNKKANFNYILLERVEAGLSLLGGEVKAVKQGNVDLSNAFVKIADNEAYLINANIPVAGKTDYNTVRSRKLLLHKKEIVSILSKIKAKRLTIVPTKVYTKGPKIKLEIALAKSKRKFEKRQVIKKKDIERKIEKQLKGNL